MAEGLVGEGAPISGGETRVVQLFRNPAVVGRVADHGDGGEVLRCRAKHGGTANVDVFEGVGEGGFGVGDGLLEGVEVGDDNVYRVDVVAGQFFQVGRIVAPGEEAAVDAGMQGLDAAFQNLREAGDV